MNINEMKAFISDIINLRNSLTDEQALQVSKLYPSWKDNTTYEVGNRVLYNDVLYKVLQNHISNASLTPDIDISLFAKVQVDDTNTISK